MIRLALISATTWLTLESIRYVFGEQAAWIGGVFALSIVIGMLAAKDESL